VPVAPSVAAVPPCLSRWGPKHSLPPVRQARRHRQRRGYANVSPIETGDDQDFRAQFETNLWGVYNVSKAAIPVLREQGGALIMQFSSMGGRVGSPRHRFPPGGQIRDRRIQPRAVGRDRSVRHLGDRRRTERSSHRRGRVVDDRPAHPRGVRPRYSPGVVRPVALRPGTRAERPKYSSRSRSVATFPTICLLE